MYINPPCLFSLQVFKLSPELRQEIDETNNVVDECNQSVFDRKVIVAKMRNYKFKEYIMRTMVKLLDQCEEDWTKEQKKLQKLKIEEKMEMAKK